MSTTSPGRPVQEPPASGPEGTATSTVASAPGPVGGGWRAGAIWYAPVLAGAAVMTSFGLWGLTRDGDMGNDEVVSRWAALLSLRQLAHLVRHVDAVHGLYYLLLHFWVVVGSSPTAIRVPSVIAMALAAGLLVVLGRRLTGSAWAGLFAALVMAVTPSISYYAQTARSYAWVFACVLAQTLVLLHAVAAEAGGAPRGQVTRWWLAYGALATLAGYLNEMSLLVLAAHALTLLLARCGRRVVKRWAVTAAVSAFLVSPLLAISIRQDHALSWISRPGLHDLWILYHDYFGATLWAPVLLAVCAAVALLPARGPGRGEDSEDSGAGGGRAPAWWSGGISLPSVAVPLLLVPAALLFVESLAGPPLYVDRYVLYGEAGVALLAGAGLWRIGRWLAQAARQPRVYWLPGIVVCVGALLLQLAPQQRVRTPGSRLYNFGGPAFYVGANARPGDGVLFFDGFYRKVELGYPAQFRDTSDFALAVPPAVAEPFRGIEKPFAAIRPLMLAHSRIWVIGVRPSPALPAGAMRSETGVLQQYFTRQTVRGYKNMWVTLWVRRS